MTATSLMWLHLSGSGVPAVGGRGAREHPSGRSSRGILRRPGPGTGGEVTKGRNQQPPAETVVVVEVFPDFAGFGALVVVVVARSFFVSFLTPLKSLPM